MNKPVLTEGHIRSQTARDENGNHGLLKGKCCPECKKAGRFTITVMAFGYLTDTGLALKSGQEESIAPCSKVTCDNECEWSGYYRDLEDIDAETWPEFKEGDRVISFGTRQNSGWSCVWECAIYVAKQRRRDGVVTWRRDGDPFSNTKDIVSAQRLCTNKQRDIERRDGVKLRIMQGIKRGTVILNSDTQLDHLMRGGE
tara:strand:- start:635 stop:1231 length:597 start_codon:yes stop_codon:yes gene_type:complete